VTATITDPDNTVEPLTTTGTDALGLDVTEDEITTRRDRFTTKWTIDGEYHPELDNLVQVQTVIPSDAAGVGLVVEIAVEDRQHNPASDSILLEVNVPPPPAPTLILGCAIGGLPDGSKSRTTRFNEFLAAIPADAEPTLRVYLTEPQTEQLIQKWEANPGRTDLWPVAGDIWTPGTPHRHDVALSMKPNLGQYVAGRYDGLDHALNEQYPGPGRFRKTCYHEPYDNIYKDNQFTLAEYKAMIGHLVELSAPYDYVDPWIVLTGDAFDLNAVGTNKDPDHFFVPGVVGVAGDRYQVPSAWHDEGTPTEHEWWTTARMFDRYVAKCAAWGVEAGFWEYGCMPDFTQPNRKSQDLLAVFNYCVANGVKILLWFDNFGPKGDWYVDAIIHRTKYFDDTGTPVGTVIPPILYDSASANTWHSLFSAV
jgi:hypothetical protein